MKLQVLVSAMNQKDYSLINKMNLKTDAIIINQCDKNEFKEIDHCGNKIKFISLAERGVGLSRNNALMRSTGDICLFADEDVTYVDNYDKLIIKAFDDNPDADMILFNVPSKNIERPTYTISNNGRVRWFNCLRYGAVKMAIRTEKIKKENIYFSLLFGGGAKYSCGEDSIFISECLKKGLKVYSNTTIIGYVSQDESSWFNGYNDKYFIDKGVLYGTISKTFGKLLCLQFVVRHKKIFKEYKSFKEALRLMLKGINMN